MDTTAFSGALLSPGPAADRDKLGLYGFLVGSWETKVVARSPEGPSHESRGEIHAMWVLEGRAIQDVWILPARVSRTRPLTQLPVTGSWYGTTLRFYDPSLDAWRILWTDPATAFVSSQIGRPCEYGIVQEGKLPSGATVRWSFRAIEANAFHWTSEGSTDEGRNWRKHVEVYARRIVASSEAERY